jgi:hypothetical protein
VLSLDLERCDLHDGTSRAEEIQLKPPKSLINISTLQSPPARTAELILWQNVISFCRNYDPTAIDPQRGT